MELLPFQSKVVVARQGKGMVGDLVLLGMKHDLLQGLKSDCLLVPLGEVKKFVLCRKLKGCLSSLEFWRHGEFPRLKPVFALSGTRRTGQKLLKVPCQQQHRLLSPNHLKKEMRKDRQVSSWSTVKVDNFFGSFHSVETRAGKFSFLRLSSRLLRLKIEDAAFLLRHLLFLF